MNSSEHFKTQTCKSVQYFLSYSGFKSRPSFSITLYTNSTSKSFYFSKQIISAVNATARLLTTLYATIRNVFVATHTYIHTYNTSDTVQAHLHNIFPLQQARHSNDFPQHTATVTSHFSIFATLIIVLAQGSK